ncbi:MAG TPA: hypothetical protein VFH73_20105 [Polyangia bacterium]|nr:hypothetical protein [Polyangia bacterium]
MKVTGPNTGTPDATPAADSSGPSQGAKPDQTGATGKAFSERLSDPAAVRDTSAAGAAAKAGGISGITSDIAAELKAGKLQPRAAVEQVMERLLQQHLTADAPPAVREKLRAALQETIDSDPFIAEKLRSLGE